MYVGGKDSLIENSPKCKEDQFSNTPPYDTIRNQI